jgi:hypothetical protein
LVFIGSSMLLIGGFVVRFAIFCIDLYILSLDPYRNCKRMTTPHSNSKKFNRKGIKPLAIAALLSAGIIQPLLPVMAATTAGQGISNTATATYGDDAGNNFTSVSNTVEITVAEVAGIEARPIGVTDVNGGSIEGTDTLRFSFTVTNVGNDSTDIQIPDPNNLIKQNFTPGFIKVYEPGVTPNFTTDNSVGTINAGDGAQTYTGDLGGAKLSPGQSITVIVFGNVTQPVGGLNAGDDISVTLGNVAPNDNSQDTQNQVRDALNNDDLFTVDLQDPANPQSPAATEDNTVGAPVDTREASAYQFVDFATQQKPLALVTVKKTDSEVDPGATGSASDDVITYDLSVTVENNSPSGAFIPTNLTTTKIKLSSGGSTANVDRILISDAIPEGTVLESAPTAPASGGWSVVYSTSDLTTSPVIDPNGLAASAEWTATPPVDLSTVKRVGFIRTSNLAANGTEITGFKIKVVASGMPATGGNIYNLAQVFGKTYDDPASPNNPVDQIIYDESGDDNPNNFENGDAPDATGDNTGSEFDPNTDTGVANPAMGTDDGSNTGTGPDGEANLVVLTGDKETGNDNILNGPNGSPEAVGPTDDDDDYTNAAIKPGSSDFSTGTPEFTNTVQNPATSTSRIDNVTVQPISPSQAEAAIDGTTTGQYGDDADIPTGTRVRVANIGNTKYAIYEYDGTEWNLEISSETYEPTPGTTAYRPLNLGTLNVGGTVNYTVDVYLPTVASLTDVAIPMIAFPDTNLDGYQNESVNNITIDRVYNGFMQLTKQARILDAEGTLIQNWTDDPTAEVQTGYVIEYRVIYKNITPTLEGSGNKSLSATSFKVIEDGNAGSNNWYPSATTHASGTSATDGTITYYQDYTGVLATDVSIGQTDPADDADVEAYVNEIGTVAPQEQGSLIIRRKVQ